MTNVNPKIHTRARVSISCSCNAQKRKIIMSQLSRLLALWTALKKLFLSSPGCWLSEPFSKNQVTALQAAGSPGHTQKIISQLSRLLALRAILKKLFLSSPGFWLSEPFSKKNHVTALQAAGFPGHTKRKHVTALQAAGSPGHTRKIMSQLSWLLALRAIPKKSCHSSPRCWLSWPC